MAKGGFRIGSGRPVGSSNKSDIAARAVIANIRALEGTEVDKKFAEMTPMQVLFYCMSWQLQVNDLKGAASTAGILMPFLHSRLANIEVQASVETHKIDDLDDSQLAQLAAQASMAEMSAH